MTTVESPSSSTGVCSPNQPLSVISAHPALTITRPSASPSPSPLTGRGPSNLFPADIASSSRRSSTSSSCSSASPAPASTATPPRGVFWQVRDHTSPAIPSHSNDTGDDNGTERARAQSLSFPAAFRHLQLLQDQQRKMSVVGPINAAPASHRPTSTTADPSASRAAQLALLAEQAEMAAIGTSNLRVARAHSQVVRDAMLSVADSTSKQAATVEPVSPTSSCAPPANGSSTAGSVESPKGARASSPPSSAVHEDVAGESTSATTTKDAASSDMAWQQVVTSRHFLPSASHLAQMFQAQEEDRKAWAGQALALQRRRWTMVDHSVERPKLAATGGHKFNSDEQVYGRNKRSTGEAEGTVDTAQASTSRQTKKRRLSPPASQRAADKRDRRVSFAAGTAGGSGEEDEGVDDDDDEMGDGTTEVDGSTVPAAHDKDMREVAAAEEDPEPTAEDGAMVKSTRRSSSSTTSSGARPQLLENVLTSFASLLESRQEACAGLAELAKSGEEIVEAAEAVTASRANSRGPSRASSPPTALRGSFIGRFVLDAAKLDTSLDSSALDTDSSDGGSVDEDAGSTVSSSSLREGDIEERIRKDEVDAQVEADAEAAMASIAAKDAAAAAALADEAGEALKQ